MRPRILILSFLIATAVRAMAQQPVLLRHIDSRQGLVNNRVLVLEQDCFGRMWIGTPYGVSCYDGYFFTNFSRSECNNRHLSNNYAQGIIALDNGDVWIATPDSLNIYRYRDDRMQAEGTERGLTDTDITALYRSKDGSGIWLGCYGNGVIRYDFQTDRFSPLHFDGESPHHVMCLNEDNNHHLWIGCRFEGVFRYDRLRGTLQKIELDAVTTVNAIHSDRNGTVWIGSDAGLYLYNAGQIRRVSINSYREAKIRTITEDDRGRIWIGSESGLWGIDTNTEYLHGTDILAEQEIGRQKNPDLLTYNSIHALCMIERDQLWVGTYGGGVDLISATPYAIRHLTPMKALGFTGQAADKTTSLCLDAAGNLLIGLDGHGVALYTGDEDYTYFSGDRIHDNHILALTEDARGRIWAGGYTKGLAVMSPDRRRFVKPAFDGNDGCIRGILPVGDSLFLAMGNDLRIYDIRANRIRFSLEAHCGQACDVRSVSPYGDSYWCGTFGSGLLCINPSTGDLRRISTAEGLASNIVYQTAIRQDTLWCATDFGISYVALAQTPDRASTIRSDGAYISVRECDGQLWFTTYSEIYRLDPGNRLKRLAIPQALSIGDYAERSLVFQSSSELVCGGFMGVNRVDIGQSVADETPGRLVFSSLQIHNRPIRPGDSSIRHNPLDRNIDTVDKLELTHTQNNITLNFVVPTYEQNAVTYSYCLDEVDREWVSLHHIPSITLHNLTPGEYRLLIRAVSESGALIATRSLDVTVRPPLWWSLGAKIGYVMLFLGLMFFIGRMYYLRLRLHHRVELERQTRMREEAIHEAKLNFFTNISHELRTPLTLLLSPVEQLKKEETNRSKLNNLQLIERNARRLLNLVNQILDFRKSQDGGMKLHVRKVQVEEQIREIVSSFDALYRDKSIELELYVREPVTPAFVDPEVLEKILLNVLSNAYKFTPNNGYVSVELRQTDGMLYVTVTNTGPGLSREELGRVFELFYQASNSSETTGSGIGLHLVKHLVELHHGEVRIDSVPGKDTTVEILLPCRAEEYASEEISVEEKRIKSYLADETVDETLLEGLSHTDRNQTILIVEDNAEIRDYLAENLRSYYQTIVAAQGEEALEILKRNHVDLILTDVLMPVMNGVDLCRAVKGDFETSHIPVVMLSAKSTMDDMLHGLMCGADAYITKPFTLSHLIVRINKLLESRERLRQRYQRNLTVNVDQNDPGCSAEDIFIGKLTRLILDHISEVELSGEALCRELNISRSSLHRKLKAVANLSAGEFIRNVRLQQAARELVGTDKTISEISYDNGFNTPSYFSTCFTTYFGVSPKVYRANNQPKNS